MTTRDGTIAHQCDCIVDVGCYW